MEGVKRKKKKKKRRRREANSIDSNFGEITLLHTNRKEKGYI